MLLKFLQYLAFWFLIVSYEEQQLRDANCEFYHSAELLFYLENRTMVLIRKVNETRWEMARPTESVQRICGLQASEPKRFLQNHFAEIPWWRHSPRLVYYQSTKPKSEIEINVLLCLQVLSSFIINTVYWVFLSGQSLSISLYLNL